MGGDGLCRIQRAAGGDGGDYQIGAGYCVAGRRGSYELQLDGGKGGRGIGIGETQIVGGRGRVATRNQVGGQDAADLAQADQSDALEDVGHG